MSEIKKIIVLFIIIILTVILIPNLDNSYIKKICGDIALEVIKSGAYYGYITESSSGLVL